MDAFYASVEQRDQPQLRGKPIIVGGTPQQRGVVSTASYEARKFGVKSAMATSKALRLCPELIIVKPHFDKYHTISKQLYQFYQEYTDIIEPLSLDECFLDVTENKKKINSATEIAALLKKTIQSQLNLTASAGVSVNKLLAKIASDFQKPDGLVVISPEEVNRFMTELPVRKIFGVGKVVQKIMKKMNIVTCGDLQKYSMLELIQCFGKFGETLYYYARGIDNRAVVTHYEAKSIGSERTLPIDTNHLKIIQELLYEEVKIIVDRLKKKNLKAKTVTIKVKYADFKLITRSQTLSEHTDELMIIFDVCLKLLKKTDLPKQKLRLIGASLANLVDKEEQLEIDFFS